MKKKTFPAGLLIMMILSSGVLFAEKKNGNETNPDQDRNEIPDRMPCPGIRGKEGDFEMKREFKPDFDHQSGFGNGPNMGRMWRFDMKDGIFRGEFINPEAMEIDAIYDLKIRKVILDAMEQGLKMQARRRELNIKIKRLSDKFKNDSSAGKEIVVSLKELNGIQNLIRTLNKETGNKIQALIDARDNDIKAADDSWLNEIDTNKSGISNYVQFMESVAPGPGF